MIQKMEYVTGFEFIRREDFSQMTREELKAHLEGRGFAVSDAQTREELEKVADADFLTEYFS